MFVMLIVILALIASYLVVIKLHKIQAAGPVLLDIQRNDSVLLVISHPDDECIFFSPIILYLKRKGIKTFLLCLSAGNFYGEGDERADELIDSCRNLGIPGDRVYCSKYFEDNPSLNWDKKLVAKHIGQHLAKTGAETIITFDDYGVSGHLNHIAAFQGVRHFLQTESAVDKIQGYVLESVSLIRKYIQVVDIFPSMLSFFDENTSLIVSSPADYYTAYNSMLRHQTQLVWYRRLVIIFSRYMFMNTLRKL